MLFKDVIGQVGTKNLLQRIASGERIPHAMLFVGPEGCGKLALALAFVQYLFCDNKSEGTACGTCASCIKSSKFIHPDIHFSFPTVGTNVKSESYLEEWRKILAENPYINTHQWLQLLNAENKQGNINKEECLSIVRKLSLS